MHKSQLFNGPMSENQDKINTPNAPASLRDFTLKKIAAIDARKQRRQLFDQTRGDFMQANREGVGDIISFTDNDYLGLSTHAEVIKAAIDATEKYGAGSGASRLVTGNNPLYGELEQSLADLKQAEDAIVFGSGYLANIGIIPTLVNEEDLILADELVHTSLRAGFDLSRADVNYFAHNDTEQLKILLQKSRADYRHVLIVVDGVYSMDGDIAPLKELGLVAKAFDAWLMSDDAHGVGVLADGRGSAAVKEATDLVPLQMGTLSKAIGAYGGYIAADKSVCDLLRSRARSLIYTTALPPAALGGALKALDIIKSDPVRCARPLLLAKKFCTALNLPEPQTPIVKIIIGEEEATMQASKALAEKGFLAWGFRPPTVPDGTSRLRFCFSASHRDEDVGALIAACLDIDSLFR